jgi:hypothetical protein
MISGMILLPRLVCRRWLLALVPLAVSACQPPPDFDHTVEVIKDSTERGVENAKQAAEVAQDPEKRKQAAEQLRKDLKNPPRQFK